MEPKSVVPGGIKVAGLVHHGHLGLARAADSKSSHSTLRIFFISATGGTSAPATYLPDHKHDPFLAVNSVLPNDKFSVLFIDRRLVDSEL